MRNKILIAAIGGAVFAATLAPQAHAQDSQTTTSETTTTTQQGPPPPPPPPPPMNESTTTTQTTTVGPPMPGYAEFGYAPDNMAAHNGYNDGYNKGISDFQSHHSYGPQNPHEYSHPTGYPGGPISKSEYYRVYREAFVHGYERGYRSSARGR